MQPIRVVVAGATGKVGREVVRGLHQQADMKLVGAVALDHVGEDIGRLFLNQEVGVTVSPELETLLQGIKPDVLVDFTAPSVAGRHIRTALERGVHPVVGTTGIPPADLEEFREFCRTRRFGAAIIPNFSVGAMLLQRFSREAVKFLPDVEIVELHHHQKLDAPSGTAARLARSMSREREIPIHSVRLPGLVAHHEVIFGGPGQTLVLRHDSMNRESFVPGVLMTIRKVTGLQGLVEDLEDIIG